MPADTEERIERLLDQLEDPNLTPAEIQRLEQKVKVLKELREQR